MDTQQYSTTDFNSTGFRGNIIFPRQNDLLSFDFCFSWLNIFDRGGSTSSKYIQCDFSGTPFSESPDFATIYYGNTRF